MLRFRRFRPTRQVANKVISQQGDRVMDISKYIAASPFFIFITFSLGGCGDVEKKTLKYN